MDRSSIGTQCSAARYRTEVESLVRWRTHLLRRVVCLSGFDGGDLALEFDGILFQAVDGDWIERAGDQTPGSRELLVQCLLVDRLCHRRRAPDLESFGRFTAGYGFRFDQRL